MNVQVRSVLVAALVAWLCACAYGGSDGPATPAATPRSDTQDPAQYPDQGLLSNYRYANAYFGFSIDLPADAGLRAIPVPIPADGSIPLLDTIGHGPERGVLAIGAYKETEEKPGQARLLLRRELDNELAIGVEELHALSKTSIAGQPFFYFETRRGIDQHAIYATDLNGFAVRFVISARNPKLLQQLQAAVTHMRFFPPASIGDFAGVGAAPYNGPAIPYRVLEQLRSNPPARQLEPGKVTGNIYDNRQLGFAYELPKGWHLKSQAAVMPAVERSREHSLGEAAVGPNQRLMRDACERTLISAWQTTPEPASGDIVYEDFGEVTLFATPLACFPNVKFPDILADKEPLRDFLVAYGESHPIMSDMKGARAFTHEGHTFIVLQGVVAYHEPGEALSRRVSVALALTRQRDYLLAFFFAAPHEAELRELMNAKASFDPEPAVKEAKTTAPSSAGTDRHDQPGGSAADATIPTQPATAANIGSANNGAASASSASDPEAMAGPGNDTTGKATNADTASPEGASTTPATAAPSRPTLLNPGETMDQQQMKGVPVSKKPSR